MKFEGQTKDGRKDRIAEGGGGSGKVGLENKDNCKKNSVVNCSHADQEKSLVI